MNMKQTFSRKWMPGNIVIVILAFLLMTCVYLDGVDMDPSVKAGEVTVFKMNVRIEPAASADGDRLVIAFLAPKSWGAAANTTVTYVAPEYETGVQTMSLVPAGTVPKNNPGQTWPGAIRNRFGFGENVLDDLEWLVYWSDKTYDARNGVNIKATVSIAVKAGPQNLRFKPTFFLNHTDDGLSTDDRHFKVFKADCFEVTDGTGDLIDFCELHFNSAQPLTASEQDFVTLTFQGDIAENDLVGADAIYLCATAYTTNGQALEVCGAEDKNRMRKQFQFGNAYTITVWPAGYFDLAANESIERIEYSFINADGSVAVMDNGDVPFVYRFNCQ
jgi:hypothetical protein